MQPHSTEDAFMLPPYGAQPAPPLKYVPANDNNPVDWDELAQAATERFPIVHETLCMSDRGQYIGLRRSNQSPSGLKTAARPGDPNGCADDLVTTTFAPLEELPVAEQQADPHQKRDWNLGLPRQGSFMQTYTGRKFWPMDPKSNEVCIRDIAHSLSLQCRYAGHCRRFLSVAEHSVHIARWLVVVAPEAALWGLLHDASEAYLVDIPRPVKPSLTGYKAAEANVMAAICARFGLPIDMPAVVHEADDRIIADELVNLVPMAWHARHDNPLNVTLQFWSPEEAEIEFLETFRALTGEAW